MSRKSVLIIVLLINLSSILIAGNIYLHGGRNQFEEGQSLTYLSAAQLLIIALLALSTFMTRMRSSSGSPLRGPQLIWAIVGTGFIYLSVDELYQIHEGIDHFVHSYFKLQETGLSDRLDDLIVGAYGLIGIGAFWIYRSEVWRFKQLAKLFVCGFVLLGLMIASDIVSDRFDIIPAIFEHNRATFIFNWLNFLEDAFKICAEAVFIACFYGLRQLAQQMNPIAKEESL